MQACRPVRGPLPREMAARTTGEEAGDPPPVMLPMVIPTVVIVVVFLILQRQIMDGMKGSVKG